MKGIMIGHLDINSSSDALEDHVINDLILERNKNKYIIQGLNE